MTDVTVTDITRKDRNGIFNTMNVEDPSLLGVVRHEGRAYVPISLGKNEQGEWEAILRPITGGETGRIAIYTMAPPVKKGPTPTQSPAETKVLLDLRKVQAQLGDVGPKQLEQKLTEYLLRLTTAPFTVRAMMRKGVVRLTFPTSYVKGIATILWSGRFL